MAFNAIYISQIGDQQNPFAYAVTDDMGNLIEEKWDHGLNNVVTATSILLTKKGAEMPSFVQVTKATNLKINFYVTDSRLTLVCKNYEKGGGWVGFDAVSILTALTINAGSKIIAAAKNKGKIFLGQIRYEWVYFIGYKRKSNWRSGDAIVICYQDAQKTFWMMTLQLKNGTDTAFIANDILRRAAKYRLEMTDEKSEKALKFFREYAAGAKIVPNDNPQKVSTIFIHDHYFAPNGEDKRPNC
jgi:hypothetical protein